MSTKKFVVDLMTIHENGLSELMYRNNWMRREEIDHVLYVLMTIMRISNIDLMNVDIIFTLLTKDDSS